MVDMLIYFLFAIFVAAIGFCTLFAICDWVITHRKHN